MTDLNNTAKIQQQQPACIFSRAQIIEEATKDFISSMSKLPTQSLSAAMVLETINQRFELENSVRAKSVALKPMTDIPPLVVAMLIAADNNVALVAPGNRSGTGTLIFLSEEQRAGLPIGIYQTDGANKGIWEVTNRPTGAFKALVEQYKPGATRNELLEIFTLVKSRLRVVQKCVVPYYVAVNNGIFDVLNKKLLPFSPDHVFTSKIHTDLNLKAANPFIPIPEDGSIWDVDSWLSSLGSPSFVKSIKEVLQAACLPLAPRNKMVLFYSKTGNNGKGTLCQLIRNLLGAEVTVSIPLKEFSTRFGMASLPGAMAVVVDENDVSSFQKGLSNLKAVITGDTVSIEQKYQDSYDYVFNGLILQCVNDLPNGDDKTGSFKRRLHIIQFPNCFTGVEKRYIKQKLIYSQDVLEYILKMVLVDMPYREAFTETEETKRALKLYELSTSSVSLFLDEILPQCQWDLLPGTEFLYEMYKVWYKRNVPSGKVIGRNEFLDNVRDSVETSSDHGICCWEWTDSTRSHGYISKPEPLLSEYELRHFQNPRYLSSYDTEKRDTPCNLKTRYSGLKRKNVTTVVQQTDSDEQGV